GEGAALLALDDAALGDDEGLAREDAVDPGEDGLAPGGELHLKELVPHLADELRRRQARGKEGARLGGEGEAGRRLEIVERLDAERVARQDEAAGAGVVEGDRVHAAEMAGEVEPVTAIEDERRLAIGLSREDGAGQLLPQLDIVVDLAVGDEGAAARL